MRVDQRERAAELIADPNAVGRPSKRAGPVADEDRHHDIAARIDSRDSSVEVVRDPHRTAADGEIDRAVADGNGVDERPPLRIDTQNGAAFLIGDPEAVRGEG
jgi:hypothetical protein